MSVFLDTSKRRKIYFRLGVVLVFVTVISVAGFLIYNLLFGKSVRPPVVKYSDTVESYHYYYSPANKNKIALTFDDGPRTDITRDLMDVLEKNKVPATLFFIGQEILLKPDIVAEAGNRGFDIGNHSFTHRLDVHNSQNRIALELHATEYLISKITGKIPTYYRPPFLLGIGIDPTINPYLPIPKDMLWSLENGLTPTGTDIDPQDWMAISSADVIKRFEETLNKSVNSHIVLLHEEKNTVEALPEIIKLVRDRGYTFVSLDELLTPPKEIALTQTMTMGATDETTGGEVSKLQWFLYQQGDLDPYLLTGIFTSETRSALTSYQLRKGLIDPNNVDLKRAGITDNLTRKAIMKESASLLPEVTNTLPPNILDRISRWIEITAIKGYINFIPIFRSSLIWMVRLALILVILRCFFIATVFFAKWYKMHYSRYLLLTQTEKKHPGVSVLIPAYNEKENIRGTIESVLRSKYPRKEILVIDDGSTDDTYKVVEDVILAHPTEPIKILRVENGGKANALNHGIEASKFDVCVVIDADAVLDPKALYYFMKHFAGNTNIGAVAGKVCTTGNKGFLNLFQTLEYAIGQNIDKRVLSTMNAVGVVPGPAGAWDKASVIAAGGFNTETLVEDQDMTLTLLRMGKRIIYEEKAVSYTETPDTVKNFLKQRFRWVYGTTQCFWKNKKVFIEKPFSSMSIIVMPNIFIFNILLPLTYPFADGALIAGILFKEWQTMVIPFLLFTLFDVVYAWIGVLGEKNKLKLLASIPIQRISYRQLIYLSVIRSVVRAIEGTGSSWNKFTKTGETQKFYFSTVEASRIKDSENDLAPKWIDGIMAPEANLNENR